MPPRLRLRLVPADPDGFRDRYMLAEVDAPDLTLGELLAEYPALSLEPLVPAVFGAKVTSLLIELHAATPEAPLYLPRPLTLHDIARGGTAEPEPEVTGGAQTAVDAAAHLPDEADAPVIEAHPARLSEREAVLIAHAREIDVAAGYLKRGMSVLIRCEKLLVEHLAARIAVLAERPARRIEVEAAGAATDPVSAALSGGNRRSMLIAGLEKAVKEAVPGDMVVIPHLDLLAGGTDASLSGEGREITDLLYEHSDRVVLAFTDPSLTIPEVLASRFAVRIAMDILPREVTPSDGRKPLPIGVALVTREEAELFEGFDPQAFYKHVAGMNAVRLRHALGYALQEYRTDEDGKKPTFDLLLHMLRMFKARNSATFELPNTHLADIGGYEDVKRELRKVLAILNGDLTGVPASLRNELIPRGFIFHGPPGTGKTLFAKAIATEMGGTIQVVSGPEVTDMYVGESERKLREVFAEARRNAPAVLVFDEFDSIAAKRTGRDDGGSRAGNAVVAQLLTELDGFRPEVPVLIIGTTNRIDIIDEALLRPSRFREIKIGLPDDPEARKAIARIHARHFEIECGDELLDAIAESTNGMNGDEIRSIFRDAKANELVGDRAKAGARVLGQMIGTLRIAQQNRDAESRELSSAAGPRTVLLATTRRQQAAISVSADAEEDPI